VLLLVGIREKNVALLMLTIEQSGPVDLWAIAGLAINPVLRTCLLLHFEFLRLWTGFELSSSWLALSCYGSTTNQSGFCVMGWPQIDLRAQDPNGI
jgi:hypothetical protein